MEAGRANVEELTEAGARQGAELDGAMPIAMQPEQTAALQRGTGHRMEGPVATAPTERGSRATHATESTQVNNIPAFTGAGKAPYRACARRSASCFS